MNAKKTDKTAEPKLLTHDTTGLDALRRLLRKWAETYDAAKGQILSSDEIEHTHQARVALRRMRSMVRGFADMLTPSTAKDLADLLASRFRLLGPLRDADVHALAYAGTPQHDESLRIAAELRAKTRSELQDGDKTSLKFEVEALLHDVTKAVRGARRQRLAEAPVGVIGSRALQTAWTEMLAFGPDLGHLSPDDLHEFRKQSKTMRYLMDALAPLHDKELTEPMLRRLSRLQDDLGHLNDLASMRKSALSGDETLPEGFEDSEIAAREGADKAWRKLRKEPVWWCGLSA